MASPEKKARYDVSRQVKDAMERDEWAEVARILSEYSRRDSDSVMTQLVSRDQWDAVKQVIRCVGDEERTWSIEGVLVKNNILLSVAEGNWRGIGEMPHERFLHSTLRWILQQACTRAQQTDIVQYVLPHCEDDQLDSALQQLVTHDLWFAAGRMLLRPVSDERVRWTIQEACQRAEELSLNAFITPSCPTRTLDFLLTELVSYDIWHAVGRVLMRGVSDTHHCWALQEACSRIESWRIKHLLLPYCTFEHCISVLADLVSKGLWGSAQKLLNCMSNASVSVIPYGMYVDNNCLRLMVRKNVIGIFRLLDIHRKVSEEVHGFCKSSMSNAKTRFRVYQWQNNVLQYVTFETNFTWVYGKQGFPSHAIDLKRVFAVISNTIITGNHKETVVCIIPQCAGHQLDSVFTQCVDNWLKSRPGHEMECNSTDFPDTLTIHKLHVNAANAQTIVILSSKSTADQLDSVLRLMFTRHVWWALGKVMEQGLDNDSINKILKQTLLYDDDQMIVEHVLPHCTDSQTDLAVTELVSAGQWKSVTKLVQLVGDRKQTWTVGETSIDTTLLHLVAGKKWKEVGDTLQRGEDDQRHNWLVQIASILTSSDLLAYVLPHYADDQLDSVLTTLVERHLWPAVGEVLKRGVSDSVKQWAVMEACQRCMKHDEYYIKSIVTHCADDQLDSVLTTLVERGLWRAVGETLERGVSDSVKRWAVKEACQHVDSYNLYNIFPHCADDQLDSVLTTLVERRVWDDVAKVLKRGVSDSVKQWAVMEACQHCDYGCGLREVDKFIKADILPHCADDQLDSVMTTLVERHLWQAIEEMLKRGVSDSVKQSAVMEACQHYEDEDYDEIYITNTILPHCADDQLDSVLSPLVERCMWKSVEVVLKRGVSDSMKQWAVEKVCEYCSPFEDDSILDIVVSHCADDQLDSVLTTLVERRIWVSAGVLLPRGVSDSVKRWAVMEACEEYDENEDYGHYEDYITDTILPHCADDQLDSVLTTLVERYMCRAVGVVLKRGVSDSVKQWAVMEACQDFGANDFTNYILPHCADDQLDSVLTTLVERDEWKAVGKVLSRFANAFFEQFVVEKTCEHCKDIGVYFRDDHNTPADAFTPDILAFCADDELDLHDTFITNDVCTAVRYESGRKVSDSQRRVNIKTAFAHADEENLVEYILPHFVYDSIQSALKRLASRCFWKAFSVLLHYCIIDTLCMWTLVTLDIDSKEKVFLDMVRNPCDAVKRQIPSFWRLVKWSDLPCSLSERLHWDTFLGEVLCEVLLGAVKEIWLSGRWKDIPPDSTAAMNEASVMAKELHQLIIPILMKCNTSCVPYLLPKIQIMRHQLDNSRSTFSPLLPVYFAKCLIQEYYKRKAWPEMTNAILIVLTTDPVVPDIQSVALRVMLRHNRWDVISHACLSGVCEQDRRQLFQTAVKQRLWSAVKRWADHTLYDDQRLWALGEARQEKRWDVYLKLADHGLSEWERVGVLFRVTMHADWKLVHRMLRTVADVTDMIDLLTNTPGVVSKFGATNYEQRMNELNEFKEGLTKDTNELKTLRTMAKRGKWWVVLHNIRHKPNLQHARRALEVAVSSEAWHAVMQLVRLETDVTRRDSLFGDMVRLRQWAVCKELLEQGVSRQLCLDNLSELKEQHQWALVAMVMECPMGDDSRKEVMHQAIMMREGSVVWECINKLHTCLSVDEREEMFQLAFSREVWQAVKPLIEETDVTGIRHRDTALLEAIEQHQWDVVDHCQRHYADINMKDDDGHTPIHRAARKGDWEAVKELTVRDGDPNLLDSEGLSVLHRAIEAKQWDAVQLLIQFHGDIHQAPLYDCYSIFDYDERKTRTPLQMLIDARQGEVIETSLMWCPDQQKVVNYKKETVLHAVCLSGWPGALHHLVARKVDPLAVTERGLTALCYAVLCKDCPQRMVAECIKLGFSTHQSHIAHTARIDRTRRSDSLTEEEQRLLMSPLVLAVMRGLPVVTQMLCEAGACSNRQLCELNVNLVELTKPNTAKGQTFQFAFCGAWRDFHNIDYGDPGYSFDTELMEQSADYLRQVSSTPRSLVSTCRLVISRCLTLGKTRLRDIAQLPLSPKMKNYLMFSDLTDPRYPDLSYRGKE